MEQQQSFFCLSKTIFIARQKFQDVCQNFSWRIFQFSLKTKKIVIICWWVDFQKNIRYSIPINWNYIVYTCFETMPMNRKNALKLWTYALMHLLYASSCLGSLNQALARRSCNIFHLYCSVSVLPCSHRRSLPWILQTAESWIESRQNPSGRNTRSKTVWIGLYWWNLISFVIQEFLTDVSMELFDSFPICIHV